MFFRVVLLLTIIFFSNSAYAQQNPDMIKLPVPIFKKQQNLKALLQERASCRDFQNKALSLEDVSNILWACCGRKMDAVTGATRTIPSAGATYPLELFLVVGKNSVNGLKEGIYHYIIDRHILEPVVVKDIRSDLAQACLGQDFIKEAPISLIIAADFKRTSRRYGARAERYVYMEAGHAALNIYLSAVSLNLGTVEVGAFTDEQVKQVLSLNKEFEPLIVMPVGYAKIWGR